MSPFKNKLVVDLDSHLIGDVPNWEQWIDEEWKSYLPKTLSGEPNQRRHTLVGREIMISSEMNRTTSEKPEWVQPQDLTPEGRVNLLDKAGIDIAVLSPNSPALDLVWFPHDAKLAAAYCRAQNNYMDFFADQYPDRMKWAGVLPLQDRDEAIKEIHRVADMGMVGVNMKAVPVNDRGWDDSYYDPVWRELASLQWPIIIHDTKQSSLGVERFAENFFFSHMVGRVLESMVAGMVFLCGGVLERVPELRVLMLETGASQMPWWLNRMDEHFEKLPKLVPWLKMKPSEYFARQMYVGCEPFEDPLFDLAIELLGDDNMVLATDTPHWDSSLPEYSVQPVLESKKLTEENKVKVLSTNAAKVLGW